MDLVLAGDAVGPLVQPVEPAGAVVGRPQNWILRQLRSDLDHHPHFGTGIL